MLATKESSWVDHVMQEVVRVYWTGVFGRMRLKAWSRMESERIVRCVGRLVLLTGLC